jgi:hypothetical protein
MVCICRVDVGVLYLLLFLFFVASNKREPFFSKFESELRDAVNAMQKENTIMIRLDPFYRLMVPFA